MIPQRTQIWEKCVRKPAHRPIDFSVYGIPLQFRETSPETYTNNDPKVVKMLGNALRKSPLIWSRGMNLMFCGPNGVGKSLVAAEIAKEVLRFYEHYAYFVSFEELVTLLEATRFTSSADPELLARLETLRTVELIVIDGLSDEVDSQHVRNALANLVKGRTNSEDKSTIITTDLSSAGLTGAFGERLAGAFEDRFVRVTFSGENKRAKNNIEKNKEALLDE